MGDNRPVDKSGLSDGAQVLFLRQLFVKVLSENSPVHHQQNDWEHRAASGLHVEIHTCTACTFISTNNSFNLTVDRDLGFCNGVRGIPGNC